MKKVLKWVLIILGILFLIGIVGGSNEKKETEVLEVKEVEQEELQVMPKTVLTEQMEIENWISEFLPINDKLIEACDYGASLNFERAEIIINEAYEESMQMVPPIRLISPHQKWVRSIALSREAIMLAKEGINTGNTTLIEESIRLVEEANSLMTQARIEINEITEELKYEKSL